MTSFTQSGQQFLQQLLTAVVAAAEQIKGGRFGGTRLTATVGPERRAAAGIQAALCPKCFP